jgi:hypothetical protein
LFFSPEASRIFFGGFMQRGIDMAGFALTVKSLSLNGTVVTKGGGVLTVNGSVAGTGSLFGGTVNP